MPHNLVKVILKRCMIFIDKYITCELPDAEIDPELYEIVTEIQTHSKIIHRVPKRKILNADLDFLNCHLRKHL